MQAVESTSGGVTRSERAPIEQARLTLRRDQVGFRGVGERSGQETLFGDTPLPDSDHAPESRFESLHDFAFGCLEEGAGKLRALPQPRHANRNRSRFEHRPAFVHERRLENEQAVRAGAEPTAVRAPHAHA